MDYIKFTAAVLAATLVATPAAAAVDPKHLDQYGKGIIEDYGDMQKSDSIEWIWVAPQLKLADHRFQVERVDNLTTVSDVDMEEAVDGNLARALERAGARSGKAPLLKVQPAIYWANRSNSAKAWIPWAGAHLAQAGVGIELVFRDPKGQIVAKMRHSGREGVDLERAAQELIDEFGDYVRGH